MDSAPASPAPFERIVLAPAGAASPDDAFPHFSWSRSEALLWRGQTLCARWRLARLASPNRPARTFALPGPDPAEPPASLWLGNLRDMAVASGWAATSDVWCEVGRAGWGGHDFNRVRERAFSPSGGALEGPSSPSWMAYAEAASIPEELLCALPWEGLAGMWGASFEPTRARRESIVLGLAAGESKKSGSRGRSGRGLKA